MEERLLQISNNPVGQGVTKKWSSKYPELKRMQAEGDGVLVLVAEFLQKLFRKQRRKKAQDEGKSKKEVQEERRRKKERIKWEENI